MKALKKILWKMLCGFCLLIIVIVCFFPVFRLFNIRTENFEYGLLKKLSAIYKKLVREKYCNLQYSFL
jgi:hypothetical protein